MGLHGLEQGYLYLYLYLTCSQTHILEDWRLETRLDYYFSTEPFFITLCTDYAENTAPILLGRRVYSAIA
jgi:hypothetical protein